MNPKHLQRDVTDVLSTELHLLHDMINNGPKESVKYYTRQLKKLCRVKALLLAAPELRTACACLVRAYEKQSNADYIAGVNLIQSTPFWTAMVEAEEV
jgi:hypothetical protein